MFVTGVTARFMERITDMSIKIDEDFKNQIPPLTAEELAGLEAGLIEAGRAINPIVVWPQEPSPCECDETDGSNCEWEWLDNVEQRALSKSNGVEEEYLEYDRGCWVCAACDSPEFDYDELIIDGHNRYEICTRLGLPFETVQMNFADRQAAEDWIDRNQLHRRNLNPNGASLLRGRIYNRTKNAVGRPENNSDKKSELTAAKLATDYGVTSRTIERDGQFARAMTKGKAPENISGADTAPEGRAKNRRR